MARRVIDRAEWWCPTCAAPRAGETCRTCGFLHELAATDRPAGPPASPIDQVQLRGRILEELPPQALGGFDIPWALYVAILVALITAARTGLAGVVGPAVLAIGLLVLVGTGILAAVRRQQTVAVLSRLVRPVMGLLPRRRLRRVLRIEPTEGALAAEVLIDNPSPWPPTGTRRDDSNVDLLFVGGWISEETFGADRIVPPPLTGRPVVVGSGSGQPLIWAGALLAATAIINAIVR
jgi:hypothetical protein